MTGPVVPKWFKGPAVLELDRWYSADNVADNLALAGELLQSSQSFHNIVASLSANGRWNASSFPHPEGGYVQGRDFERVARDAYLKAIDLALGHSPPVPIKIFWMTRVANRFASVITDDSDHVSVTLLVPEVPGGSRDPASPQAWAVIIDDDDQVVVTQTSGSGYEDEEESSAEE
jgi:hypothetical protein